MNIGFCPLASSSKGNSYLINSDDTLILLDAGISGTKIDEALKIFNTRRSHIDGLIITHEHIDHIRGASRVMTNAVDCKLYCSKGTFEASREKINPRSIPDERVHIVSGGETFQVGDIEVTAFAVSHDSEEPLAFSFEKNGKKISIVTDTGKITDEIQEAIADSDILAIESNHEVNILLYGRYPYHVKHRILSDEGHLSNEACGKCLCKFIKNKTRDIIPYVYLAHLSQENNTPQQALLTIKNILEEEGLYVGKDLRLNAISPEETGEYIVL